jgi:predicted dehydrogenase/threonine dehydrogenase-like Zn-dependent dehydrogenase
MKQVLQNMRDGKTTVTEVPLPSIRPGMALVRTCASLVSAGTERMVVEFAEKSLLGKARSRPDLVRQVMDKARREGLLTTVEAAFNRLDQPMALGYSSAGVIEQVGAGLPGFKPGDRVACAGGGYAVHAEYALVPKNLLIPIPDQVDFESAAFATLGAIALHGFRLAQPQLGENVAIIGMGLLGLLSAGIAHAAGCHVFGIDLDPSRVELAKKLGYPAILRMDAISYGRSFTSGLGFDSVLICADTRSNDPVELAGILARDRAKVVAVGAVGFQIPRKLYYEKELDFLVSRSYGPGRYDPAYEERGLDYPPGYVRWTEGRNIAAFVDLLGSNRVDVKPLISHRFPIEQAGEAYELITGKTSQPFLGVLLTYPDSPIAPPAKRVEISTTSSSPTSSLCLGVLGAGNYANAVFLPIVQKAGKVKLTGIASAAGLSAAHAARRYGFQFATSDEKEILENTEINLVAVLTRHSAHARQILAAMKAGKHVFCEKPLAVTAQEVDEIESFLATRPSCLLTVGFNRRFAPYAIRLKEFISTTGEPLSLHYRVNAGPLPLTHWLHDPAVGGGRIIGEGCHFIDFLTFLTGSLPQAVTAVHLPDAGIYNQDNVHMTFTFSNGSVGTLTYLANGDRSFPKERVEVFSAGRVGVLDDFRSLELVRDGHRQSFTSHLRQDKGHAALWSAFLSGVEKGATPPIPYAELLGVTRASIVATHAIQSGIPEVIPLSPEVG